MPLRDRRLRRSRYPSPVLWAAVLTAAVLAAGCAQRQVPADTAAAPRAALREAALAATLDMPQPNEYESHALDWRDAARDRPVPARLYLPAATSTAHGDAAARPVPLLVFSHGIGGSREGYTYLGKYLAARGYGVLHVQHVGSDRALWRGNPLGLLTRLQAAATEDEAIARVRDLSFALDQVLRSEHAQRLDARRVVAAGHSYGANTVLLAAGARVERDGRAVDLRDPRIRAAVIISAPPFHGEDDQSAILAPIGVPTLHITATGDDIRIPGYTSGVADRAAVFEATGGPAKSLVVFKDGSHSIFTDRLGTGGAQLNPRVKAATRDAVLAFLQHALRGQADALDEWRQRNQALVARYERR